MKSPEMPRQAVFEMLEEFEHEKIIFCHDKRIGLKAVIAVHDTTLGPAIGGVRMLPYRSEQEAVSDVLRLSKAMTYKAAISGVNLGGGTAVIIGDNNTEKTEVILRRLGQFVEELNGNFIASLDVGTTSKDMEYIRMETKHVVGLPKSLGGSGDTAPFTARGVFLGMKAAVKEVYGTDSMAGRTVAVQGTGKVGEHLVALLRDANAKVYVSDIAPDRMVYVANKYGANPVANVNLFDLDFDIYAPCALGGTVNHHTINRMKCKIIAGSANNQLADEVVNGEELMEKDIIFAPDFLINAGGLLSAYSEIAGYSAVRTASLTENIYEATREVIKKSKAERIPTHLSAKRIAEDRMEQIGKIK
ncbi:Glu/Leu/Phe/Val family dehydrogenase [Olivibacter sitiensis]|uniref:Glu/Leu/Phe/Val family dehydrogenase n=1 Tax=Olivibacter sitiensis TaxID=376470 RepID=UPI0003F877C6|nr:Glu/Leu/Phe/Val dehydrogenase dimerization domain-containing protein [Olivibacter sitiensis]